MFIGNRRPSRGHSDPTVPDAVMNIYRCVVKTQSQIYALLCRINVFSDRNRQKIIQPDNLLDHGYILSSNVSNSLGLYADILSPAVKMSPSAALASLYLTL